MTPRKQFQQGQWSFANTGIHMAVQITYPNSKPEEEKTAKMIQKRSYKKDTNTATGFYYKKHKTYRFLL
jgi:hypothetical protein